MTHKSNINCYSVTVIQKLSYNTTEIQTRDNNRDRSTVHTFITNLVPLEIACFNNSPGRMRQTVVWILQDKMVDFLEYVVSGFEGNASQSECHLGAGS